MRAIRDILRYIGYSLLMMVVFVAAGFLTQSLETHPGYRAFVAVAARAGWVVLICAVTFLVADIAAMVVYTIRHGQTGDRKGAVTEDGPLPLSLDTRVGRSKRKSLGSK